MTAATLPTFDLIGAGNPIMDLLAPVTDDFLRAHVAGEKGGMTLVEAAEMDAMLAHLASAPARAPGGSASNTTVGAARLGLRTTYLGKIGNDATAAAYLEQLLALGIDTSRLKRGTLPHARCLALITPDSQRTLRTYLGAAVSLSPAEISPAEFAGARHAHIEGYLLFNPALATAVVESARAAGCTISLDLASFEVVKVARGWIFEQLQRGLHLVFGNEDEVQTLFETTATDEAGFTLLARRLAAHGAIAAVKLGKEGALVARGAEIHRVAPFKIAQAVDTTGAGDAWAAGFLYGYVRGWPLPAAGRLASRLGAETVRHVGAVPPDDCWPELQAYAAGLVPS